MTTDIIIRLIGFVSAIIFIVSLFKILISLDKGDRVTHKKYLRIFVVVLFLIIGLFVSTELITIRFINY